MNRAEMYLRGFLSEAGVEQFERELSNDADKFVGEILILQELTQSEDWDPEMLPRAKSLLIMLRAFSGDESQELEEDFKESCPEDDEYSSLLKKDDIFGKILWEAFKKESCMIIFESQDDKLKVKYVKGQDSFDWLTLSIDVYDYVIKLVERTSNQRMASSKNTVGKLNYRFILGGRTNNVPLKVEVHYPEKSVYIYLPDFAGDSM